MYYLNGRRRKYFLSKFLIGVFISSLCFIVSLAVTIQGVSPDINGTPLPEGIKGYYASTFWISNMYLQESATGPTFNEVVGLWSNSSVDFSTNVSDTLLNSNTSGELYTQLGKFRNYYYTDTDRGRNIHTATLSMKVIFENTLTIPANEQCEFWVRVNSFSISGVGIELPNSTTNTSYTYTAKYVNNIFDDRWIGSQHYEPYVVWDNLTTLTANEWICYRSDTSDSDRTISGVCLLFPPGNATDVYGVSAYPLNINISLDFSPLLVGDLDNFSSSPPETEPPVVTPDDPQLDEIINGSPDMDPDVSTPNYGDIEPDSDYNVGGLVGEDQAISNLENMQGAANDLVGSFGFVQASNFWQDVFAKIFNLAGASVMASISGAIIVIRAVIGR